MKDKTPVFSKPEMDFLTDQQILLSKITIGKKMEALFGQVEKALNSVVSDYSWPDEVLTKSGKLSKGENYLGLPYYLLDYPRRFDREDAFAFRTMFWWGNFFSATLHISGEYLETSRGPLADNIDLIKSSKAYICVNNNPWEYHYEHNNYCQASELTSEHLAKIIAEKPFVKLSFQWGIAQYMNIPSLVPGVFKEMLYWLVSGQR